MTFPLTLIFMFLVFWRPQEWLVRWLYGWPLLDVIVGGAVLAFMMESGQKARFFPKTPAIGLAFGLFFASIMSHAAHTYFQGMLNTIPETFKLCFFLVLLLVVLDSLRRLQAAIGVLVVGAMLMAVHAILQNQTGTGFAGYPPGFGYSASKEEWVIQTRFFGIFNDPNDLGQFLATCIPLAFAIPKRLGFVEVVLGCAVTCLLAIAMGTTHSRGTLVGAIAAVVCMVFLVLPARWLPYAGVVALVGGLVLCAYGGRELLDESARERLSYWGFANKYFKAHPVFGGGYGMFGEITRTDRAAHNAFVLCYTELGFFGYWFWFNMITLGLIGCWRTRIAFRKPNTLAQSYLRRVAGVAIVSMVGFAASAYFLSRAYIFPLFFLFAILASIPVIAQRCLPDGHPPLIQWRKDVLFTGTAASLVSVVYIYVSILLLNRGGG